MNNSIEKIKEEKKLFKHSNDIYTKLTKILLGGNSIDAIIREIKNITGKDIIIIDLCYHLSYYTIKNKNALKIVNKNIAKLINDLKKCKKKYYNKNSNLYYNIFPIMKKDDVLSWLCILSSTSDDLSDYDIITARHGTTIIALELVKRNEIMEIEQSIKGDFIDSLLFNNDTQYIKKCCQRYGFDTNTQYRIISVNFNLTKNNNKVNKLLKNRYKLVNRQLKTIFPNSVSLIKGQMIVSIIEYKSTNDKYKIKEFINLFADKYNFVFPYNKNRCGYRIGISPKFCGINMFKKSYLNAIQAFKTISFEQEKKYVYYEELEVKRFLMNNDLDELKIFAHKILAPLKNYKNSSKTDFIKTLKIYLQSNCNWTQTKNELHIHGNTLTYRLNRINEILNIDLDNYNDRLRLQIAYEILDLLKNQKNPFLS